MTAVILKKTLYLLTDKSPHVDIPENGIVMVDGWKVVDPSFIEKQMHILSPDGQLQNGFLSAQEAMNE
jgi:hypothetical protein